MNSVKFEDAYLELVNNSRVFDTNLAESASVITQQCALVLSVCRVSIWVSHDDESVLHCLSLYKREEGVYESGATLDKASYPRYFSALSSERVIDAGDAYTDHRTSELTEPYLKHLNIRSLLDATLRNKGRVKGVLCLEMTNEQRSWTNEEQMFVASVADLISQKIIIDELASSEEKYKALYQYTNDGIAVFSKGVFSDVNPAVCKMFKGSKKEIIGKSPIELSPECQFDGQLSAIVAMNHIEACLRGTPQNFEWTHKRLDGTEFFADITLNAVRLNAEDTLFAHIRDINDKKEAEVQAQLAKEKLLFRAAHDSLTGLMNRDQLHSLISNIIEEAGSENNPVKLALLLLDLNRFKEINDTLGHAAGDKLLVALAGILKECVTNIGGCLFRLGGDEFVAVFDSKHCTVEFDEIESIIHQSLKASISLDDIRVEMSASIGIAVYPDNGDDSHELLRCADVAMYQAKNNDGVSAWYDAQNDLNNKRRLAMIVELGAAVSHDQLVLHFQPRINIKTGDITGCEALVRWEHPKHGLVLPDEFLPIAEMSELIHPLSEWVLVNVVKHIKYMLSRGFQIPIAMNFSAKNLTDSRLVDSLQSLLDAESIDSRLLEVELTESALINHPQKAVENLEKLDQLGVSIAIDDFGTGYSSLSYLKELPLDTLKIDRSFVMDMLNNDSDSVIVNSTIDLAHNFSLKVVAEGVEDQATLDELEARDCDQAQGYYIAKPMTADAFDTWLDNYYLERQGTLAAS